MNQQQQGQRRRTDISLSQYGSLNAFYWYQIFVLDFVVVKHKICPARTYTSSYCHVLSQRNNLVKLKQTMMKQKQGAIDSHIVQAKENL